MNAVDRDRMFGRLPRSAPPRPTLADVAAIGDAATLDRLIQDGADPSANDNAALIAAVRGGHVQAVERLLRDGRVDPVAAILGYVGVVDCLLLDRRIDPNLVIEQLVDDLHFVALYGEDKGGLPAWASLVSHDAVAERLVRDERVNLAGASALFTRIGMIRTRATAVCIGLQDLDLPALVTLEILDAVLPNNIRMAAKWDLIVAVKHFHDRRR